MGIAMDYPVRWGIHRIIRDFVQNFYDSIGSECFADEFEYQWQESGKGRRSKLDIRMGTKGHAFSYEWLTYIGSSTKTGNSQYAGEYGEGFKIALLCLVRSGATAVMSSGSWELRPVVYMEEIDGKQIEMFGYDITGREDDGYTSLAIYGIHNSRENVRYIREALLEYFYPGNPLFGQKIEETDKYALFNRSDMPVPCMEREEIEGVLYYKHMARGRLPFPAVIHLKKGSTHFDSDRSRELLPEAAVIDMVYQTAVALSPEGAFYLLVKMEKQWKEIPKFIDENGERVAADLHTWYYVICVLVRKISSSKTLTERFVQRYPIEQYAYLERRGSDAVRNRLICKAKTWFGERNSGQNRRRLVNPVFRLLGAASVVEEYQRKEEADYRKPTPPEWKKLVLVRECAEKIVPSLINDQTEIVMCVEQGRMSQTDTRYCACGVPVSIKVSMERNYKGNGRYNVKRLAFQKRDLSENAKFEDILLKYITACSCKYGTERSKRINSVLTDVGAQLYMNRKVIRKYAEMWESVWNV